MEAAPASTISREQLFRRVVEILLAQEKKPLSIAVFGSWARGDNRPDSDLDVLVEVDYASTRYSLFDLIGQEHLLTDSLGLKVDLHTGDGLKPRVRARVERDLVRLYP
jgi:predicted nucleotidyltransferase